MRIHPVVPETTGNVWQISVAGVRRVAIRRAIDATTCAVSRFVSDEATGGGFCARSVRAATSDLFLVEQDARVEFDRRRRLTHCTGDRRVRRERRDGDLRPAEGVLAGLAIGLSYLALLI